MGLLNLIKRLANSVLEHDRAMLKEADEYWKAYSAICEFYYGRISGWTPPDEFLHLDLWKLPDPRTRTGDVRILYNFNQFLESRGCSRSKAWFDAKYPTTFVETVQPYAGIDRYRYFELEMGTGHAWPIQVGSINAPVYEVGVMMRAAKVYRGHVIGFDRDKDVYKALALPQQRLSFAKQWTSESRSFRLLDLPMDILSLVVDALIKNGDFVFEADRQDNTVRYYVGAAESASGLRASCTLLRREFDRLLGTRVGKTNHTLRIRHRRHDAVRQMPARSEIYLQNVLPKEAGHVNVLYECNLSDIDAPPDETCDYVVHFLEMLFHRRPRTSSIRILFVFHAQALSHNSRRLLLDALRDFIFNELRNLLRRGHFGPDVAVDLKLDLETILLRPTTCLTLRMAPPSRLPDYRLLSFSDQPDQEAHIFHGGDVCSLIAMANKTLKPPSEQIKHLRAAFFWTHSPPAMCTLPDYKDMRELVSYKGTDVFLASKMEDDDNWTIRHRYREANDLISEGRLEDPGRTVPVDLKRHITPA